MRTRHTDPKPKEGTMTEPTTAPQTITVEQYLNGEGEGLTLTLHTFHGDLVVTGVSMFSDGPWLWTGKGMNAATWCVSYQEPLTIVPD